MFGRLFKHPRTTAILVACLLAACSSAPQEDAPRSSKAATSATAATGLLDAATTFVDAPLDSTRTLTHIGFGSCLQQRSPQPILDTVLDESFELFLFLGDNVYGDVRSEAMTELRQAYRRQATSPALRSLRAETPVLAVWDDHDYGLNDAGAEFFGKQEAQRYFEEFWNLPADSPVRQRPGTYDAVIVGPPGQRVQFLLLDTRYFRSPIQPSPQPDTPGKERYVPDPDPDKTILGAAQWAWLEEQLRQPAELRLVVSSIQILAEGHGWEAWRLLPTERRRLYDTLRTSGAEGLVLLSGDRHRAGIYRHPEAIDYPLYEITSSSLNVPIPNLKEEAGPRRLGPTYGKVNYGAIDIDWQQQTVRLEVRDLDGQGVLSETIELTGLRPPTP